MPISSKCPKCSEPLAFDYESYCLNCGYRHYERPEPSNSPRTSKNANVPAQPDLASTLSDQHVRPVEESCIQAAYKTLRRLPPPFTYKFDGEGLLSCAPLPCFFFSAKLKEATGGISAPRHFEKGGLVERWTTLGMLIAGLPANVRGPVWILLRRCDSELREATSYCDIEIGLYLDIITREQERINTLRSTACQTTLFTFSLNDSLLRYCDSVQIRLDEAANLVEEARMLLEPAKMFFLNQRSETRSMMKRRLLRLLQALPIHRKEAAAKAAELLKLADPERPAAAGSIRNL